MGSLLFYGDSEGRWTCSHSNPCSSVSSPIVTFQVIAQLCFRRKDKDLGELRCMAVSPVNGGIALGWSSAVVQLWTRKPCPVSNASPLRSSPAYCEPKGLKGHADSVTAVKFSDAGLLLTACVDGRLKIWDAVGSHIGRCVRTVVVSDSGVKCLKLLSSQWFVGCVDGTVHSRKCCYLYPHAAPCRPYVPFSVFRSCASLFVLSIRVCSSSIGA